MNALERLIGAVIAGAQDDVFRPDDESYGAFPEWQRVRLTPMANRLFDTADPLFSPCLGQVAAYLTADEEQARAAGDEAAARRAEDAYNALVSAIDDAIRQGYVLGVDDGHLMADAARRSPHPQPCNNRSVASAQAHGNAP